MGAEKIEVAQILVPRVVQHLKNKEIELFLHENQIKDAAYFLINDDKL
jgi:hypothetical protein